MTFRSMLYEGTVRHRRYRPGRHAFTYKVYMPLVDLTEIDDIDAVHPLWRKGNVAAVQFRRSDYIGHPTCPLDESVRQQIWDLSGERPTGPIRLLANVRTWGWSFNPIAIYFVYDDAGETVQQIMLDVANTPWNEHTPYLIPVSNGRVVRHRFTKQMHVSPFMEMDCEYVLSVSAPGETIIVRLVNERRGLEVFDADLVLNALPLTRANVSKMLRRHPLMTMRVSLGIHVQALKLWLKGIPYQPHPSGTRFGKVGANNENTSPSSETLSTSEEVVV